MGPSTPITGRCLCGGVRFEVSAPLLDAEYCHCSRCRRRTGAAASASASIEPGSLRVTEGEALIKVYRPQEGWNDHFCSNCGSQLFASSKSDPDDICVSLGPLDGDPGVRPEYHQFIGSKAPWEQLPNDGLPRYEERPPA